MDPSQIPAAPRSYSSFSTIIHRICTDYSQPPELRAKQRRTNTGERKSSRRNEFHLFPRKVLVPAALRSSGGWMNDGACWWDEKETRRSRICSSRSSLPSHTNPGSLASSLNCIMFPPSCASLVLSFSFVFDRSRSLHTTTTRWSWTGTVCSWKWRRLKDGDQQIWR